MSHEYDDLDEIEYGKHDFPLAIGEIIRRVPLKKAILLLILLVVVFNDIFVQNVLGAMPNASFNGNSTTKGTLVQILVIIIGYIIIDLAVQGGLL